MNNIISNFLVSVVVRAKYHRLDGLSSRYFSHNSRCWEVQDQDSNMESLWEHFRACIWRPLAVSSLVERESYHVSHPSYKGTNPSLMALLLGSHLNLITSKDLTSKYQPTGD